MKIRFIKLGRNGQWEKSCIEDEQSIRLGYAGVSHEACIRGDWDEVRGSLLLKRSGNKATATSDLNQIRDFYEAPEGDIWITFYQRRLYWCNAQAAVTLLPDGTRMRKTANGWTCHDRKGRLLSVDSLDGRVSKVQGYRGTICGVEQGEYLLRKIGGEQQLDVGQARESLERLQKDVQALILGLWWPDFELLVDLIFSRSGWQRISVLGKTEKDIDLDVFSAVANRRAYVQVKSATDSNEFRSCVSAFRGYPQYDEMYFVYHSCKTPLEPQTGVSVWGIDQISKLVIQCGLVDWLLAKRS